MYKIPHWLGLGVGLGNRPFYTYFLDTPLHLPLTRLHPSLSLPVSLPAARSPVPRPPPVPQPGRLPACPSASPPSVPQPARLPACLSACLPVTMDSSPDSSPVCLPVPATSESEPEKEGEPGLLFFYDVAAVHVALGQPGSPIQQEATEAQSVESFKKFIYSEVLKTPCSAEDNGVLRQLLGQQQPEYFPNVFHRLSQDLYDKIKKRLTKLFCFPMHRIGEWSINVSSDGPNGLSPHSPLGAALVIKGGVGLGQVYVEQIAFSQGIFRI